MDENDAKALSVGAVLASCGGGGGGDNEEDVQLLEITTYVAAAGTRTLHLLGPRTLTFGEVTYYIFGSDEDFGDNANVPLLSERMDEVKFGPLTTGEEQRNVDLSPWDEWDFIYVRAPGTEPNRAYPIRFSHAYEFTTNWPRAAANRCCAVGRADPGASTVAVAP
jgi:hypothetical protein